MRKGVSKFGKTVLASAIALGGLGVIQTSEPLEAQANVKSDVDFLDWYKSYNKNEFTAYIRSFSDYSTLTDFKTRHIPTFTIQNSSGVMVQRGSLNHWIEDVDFLDVFAGAYKSRTNISVASLPSGHYRIKLAIRMDDGTVTSSNYQGLTQAFTIKPDRSIVDIRP